MNRHTPNIFSDIRAAQPHLNPTLQRVAETVIERASDLRTLNIKDLADLCEVSQSSISRFVRAVGSTNYQEFRIRVAEDVTRSNVRDGGDASHLSVYEGITASDDAGTILAKVSRRQADVLNATAGVLGEQALEYAASLVKAAASIVFFGVGSSWPRLRGRLYALQPDRQAVRLQPRPELADVLCRRSDGRHGCHSHQRLGPHHADHRGARGSQGPGARTIAVTSSIESPLTAHADVVLQTAAPFGTRGGEALYESMASKMGQLLAIDALYALVAVKDHERSLEQLKRTDRLIARSRKR